MKHDLRLAFSVILSIPCVLVIVLWVRSHYWHEHMHLIVPIDKGVQVNIAQTFPGLLSLHSAPQLGGTIHYDLYYGCGSKTHALEVSSLSPVFKNREISGISIRFWFLTLITGVFTVMAWWKPKTSFNLRTMLIGMTIVATMLGIVAYALRWT